MSCAISDSGDDKKLKSIVVTSKLIQSRDLMRPTEVELERYVICIIIYFTQQIQQPILKLQNYESRIFQNCNQIVFVKKQYANQYS